MDVMKHYKRKFRQIRSIIRNENPVIVEIGSHYGEDTLRFLETFRNPTIHCFEPDPRNLEIFLKHVSSNKVNLYKTALSDKNSTEVLYQSFDSTEINHVPDKYDWIDLEDYRNLKLNNSGSSSLKKGYELSLIHI